MQIFIALYLLLLDKILYMSNFMQIGKICNAILFCTTSEIYVYSPKELLYENLMFYFKQ